MQGNGSGETAVRTGTTVLDAGGEAPLVSRRRLTSVWPNPTASLVRVDLRLAGGESVALDVFDVRGRRVRHLTSAAGGASARGLVWDLRAERGRAAVAGLYLLRASTRDWAETARVVVVR